VISAEPKHLGLADTVRVTSVLVIRDAQVEHSLDVLEAIARWLSRQDMRQSTGPHPAAWPRGEGRLPMGRAHDLE